MDFSYFVAFLLVAFFVAMIIFAVRKKKTIGENRKCLSCNFEGKMKTWLSNYGFPQFLALILLLVYLIPGIIFIAWAWKKYKCPQCGALGKNVACIPVPPETIVSLTKKCPFCAEEIKAEAIKCKYCNSNL